jgi:3-methyladenine DNA glycosylase/8-oxoguanine DNA glycosylase
VPVGAVLGPFRRGGGDPCHRLQPDGALWRATRTPDGPVLLRLQARPADGEVLVHGWGPGADWALDGAPELLGSADDPAGFEPAPEHPALVAAHRARQHWRVPRSRAVFEALAAAALEQRVTGVQAHAAWRQLVLRFGEPAPGPAAAAEGFAAGMRVPPAPEQWAAIPSWEWLRAGVEQARSRVVIAAAAVAGRLETTVDLPGEEAARVLRTLPGVGVWTAAEVRQRANGDADAFSWADYHVSRNVCWALTGQVRDDAACAALIERYRGHRFRVQRLLELAGASRPRRGPRLTLPTHLPGGPGSTAAGDQAPAWR